MTLLRCLGAAALGLAPAALSAEPVRHPGPEGWPILAGVTIPAGSELVILSGQVPPPLNPDAPLEALEFGDTRAQAMAAFRAIESILRDQGLGMANVVKLTVFLVGDPHLKGAMDFAGFSAAYGQFFGTAEQPKLAARSVVQVAGLAHPRYLVEIEAIAVR